MFIFKAVSKDIRNSLPLPLEKATILVHDYVCSHVVSAMNIFFRKVGHLYHSEYHFVQYIDASVLVTSWAWNGKASRYFKHTSIKIYKLRDLPYLETLGINFMGMSGDCYESKKELSVFWAIYWKRIFDDMFRF